ncbi:MAG: hypothetical protein EON54_13880 [Alcaligenaceae bacterium]|nr:MAG: hypothetical protein EON54_13880 [Alcaligenaceae bacterium]
MWTMLLAIRELKLGVIYAVRADSGAAVAAMLGIFVHQERAALCQR